MEAKLVVFRKNGSKREFPLSVGKTTIGRKQDCDIRIPVASVSRHHVEILVEEDGVTIRDLNSSNGTTVNGRRVTEEELEPGDQIQVGTVVFTIQIDGEPSEAEMVKIPSKLVGPSHHDGGSPSVATSSHVATSDDQLDPIAALEALASSADQTAITPEEDLD